MVREALYDFAPMNVFPFLRLLPAVAAGSLLLLSAQPAAAAAVKYPKDAPVFTVEVPDGWRADEDTSPERVLSFSPKSGGALKYQIYLLGIAGQGTTDLADSAQKLAESTIGNNSKITEIKFGAPAESRSTGGVPVARETAACKIEGTNSYFVFAVFAPVETRRFEAVLCTVVSAKDAGVGVLDSILRSVKPLK